MRSRFGAVLPMVVVLVAGCTAPNGNGPEGAVSPVAPSTASSTPTAGIGSLQTGVVRIESTYCDGSVGSGSGFIAGDDLVATVAHVVQGARTLSLRTPEGVIRGEVVGIDPEREVALVRAVKPLPGFIFAMADEAPQVTDEVLVMGYPEGRPLSTTTGAVSAVDRRVELEGNSISGLIQTDAAVNPGNSGGPMVDSAGRVVGLVEAKGEGEGLAYAVPAAIAAPLLEAWKASPGEVPPPSCPDPFSERVDTQSVHPDAPALARAFYDYIGGINSGYLKNSWNVLTGDAQGRYGDLAAFEEAQSTSTISDFILEKASRVEETVDTADASFVSRQDPEFSTSGEGCTIWHLRYTMRMDSGLWLIDGAKDIEPPKPCPAVVLGTEWAPNQQGYGTTAPKVVYNGGSPSGRVQDIAWKDWGSDRSFGSGTGLYVGPDQSTAEGTLEPATVVAFNLGTCGGTASYNAVTWFFPGRGQEFDPDSYINPCTGDYVGF
jgi:serine protease Do